MAYPRPPGAPAGSAGGPVETLRGRSPTAGKPLGSRREDSEVQLQPRGPGLETDVTGGVLQVVARDPVPAEDQVHGHRGHRYRLAENVLQ